MSDHGSESILFLTASTCLNNHDFRFSNQGLHLTKISNKQLSIPGLSSVFVQQVAKLVTMTNNCQQETVAVHVIIFICDPFLKPPHFL